MVAAGNVEPALEPGLSYDLVDEDIPICDKDVILPLSEDEEHKGKELIGKDNITLSSEEVDDESEIREAPESIEHDGIHIVSITNEDEEVTKKEVSSDGNEGDHSNCDCGSSVLGTVGKNSPTKEQKVEEKKSVRKILNNSLFIVLGLLIIVAARSLLTHQDYGMIESKSEDKMTEYALPEEETCSSTNHNSRGNKSVGDTRDEVIEKCSGPNTNLVYDDAVFAAQHHPHLLLTILNERPEYLTIADENGWTLLHEAVRGGKIESVCAVLAFILNMKDGYESRKLFEDAVWLARHLGYEAIAELLASTVEAYATDVSADKDHTESKDNGDSGKVTTNFTHDEAAIAANYFPSLLLIMLSRQPDLIHRSDSNNWTLLNEAARSGKVESLYAVLPFMLNIDDEEKKKRVVKDALGLAKTLGHNEVASLLKETTTLVDVGSTDETRVRFTYEEALLAVHNNPSLLLIILSKNLDFINHVDADNWTLLHEAIRSAKLESVSVVVAFTLSMSNGHYNNSDESALILAKTLGYTSIVELLLDTGVLGVPLLSDQAVLEDGDNTSTAFTYEDAIFALIYDQTLLNTILSRNPEYLDVTDENGWTLLHEAVRGRRIDSISTILDFVDVSYLNMRTKSGGNAMWLATLFKQEEIVKLLEARGGVLKSPRDDTWTF